MAEHNEGKLCNPAAIGLAGFAMTTFILQAHNLGWVGIAPVIWIGIFYGGLCQWIAGYHEFRIGNNFGFSAFTSYGAFWVALCAFVIAGDSPAIAEAAPFLKLTANGLGWFLAVWGFYTLIMFIASMRHHTALALLFLTLMLGFFGLAIAEWTGAEAIKILSAWDLIITALVAWYIMAHVICADIKLNLPVGKAWF